jgi:TRAP-type transport system periplasmic protein
MLKRGLLTVSAAALLAAGLAGTALAQETRQFTFGYDQPKTTGYGFAGDVFAETLAELSNGTMIINQFPGGQLGQEPQMLQKMRSGDIDFVITSSANGATVSPQLGVMSIHYLFRDADHLARAVASPELNKTVRDLVSETVDGGQVLTLMTLGLRNIYGKQAITKVEDLQGMKIRVQATKTEDTMFPAYGAQTVHMPFGEVYTSLQTGVVNLAENGVNVYMSNKHYEVAPIMSMTEHEANNNLLWVSQKTWDSFSEEQQGWVLAAAEEVGKQEPPYALKLEAESGEKLTALGVKLVQDVDKTGFIKAAEPLQDQLAEELGPVAVEIVQIIRNIK